MSDDHSLDLPRRTVLGGLAGVAGVGAAAGVSTAGDVSTARERLPHNTDGAGLDYTVEVTQREGKPVNWVLPGPRRISEVVFGTPDNPLMGDAVIRHAKNLNPEMADFLDRFPISVALPTAARQTTGDGSSYTVTSIPTPFSDDHRPVEGRIDLVYEDRSPFAGFKQGRDDVELDVRFTDPADNTYRASVAQLDRETREFAGGVLVGGTIHGSSGTGSPLFPRVYNYASFWGVGTLDINDGQRTLRNRVMHFMTTEMARDSNYALAVDENMPLAQPYLGRSHHTHGFFFPIRMTEAGPQFDPLDIPFPPGGGPGQPFIHIMYDFDEVSITAQESDGGGGGGQDGGDSGGGGSS